MFSKQISRNGPFPACQAVDYYFFLSGLVETLPWLGSKINTAAGSVKISGSLQWGVTWDDLDRVAQGCRGVSSVLSGLVLALGNIPHEFSAFVADQVLSAPLQAA